jgi:hypothetical protein
MNAILALAIFIVLVGVPAALFWVCKRVPSPYRWALFALLLTLRWGISILPAVLELPDLIGRIEQNSAELLEGHTSAALPD